MVVVVMDDGVDADFKYCFVTNEQWSHAIANMRKNQFFVAIWVIGAKTTFLSLIANKRPTNELKAFFAFAESLPTSVTLPLPPSQMKFFHCNS